MYKISPAAYIFTHQYLNTMQQGIQAGHVIAELFVANPTSTNNWAMNDKTIKILNAGSGQKFDMNFMTFSGLVKFYDLPHAFFHEPDVNGMMTGFGFIMDKATIKRIEEECKMMENDFDEDPESQPMLNFLSSLRSAK